MFWLTLFILAFFLASNIFAQDTWTQTYGGTSYDYGYSVVETSDQAYLITGYTWSYGYGSGMSDIWLIKTAMNGDTLWAQTYGGASSEYGKSVIETSDQAYLITGETGSYGSGDGDIWLIKTDMNGETLWTQTYGGTAYEHGHSVIETSDQAYLITGHTESYGSGGYDVWLIKTDINGETLWTQTYGGTSDEHGYSVIETSDQGYLITGDTRSYGSGGYDVWLIKTDMNGDTLWTQTYGGTSYDYGFSVIETSDQGYLINGDTRSYGSGGYDIWLIKTDWLGNTTLPTSIVNETVPHPSHSLLLSPNPTNSTCSFTYTLPERSKASIAIFDINGTRVWSHEYGDQDAGTYTNLWMAKDEDGVTLGSGIYIVHISTKSWKESRKLVLVK